jgi:hypothetical protein
MEPNDQEVEWKMCEECFGTYSHAEDCSRILIDLKPFVRRPMERNREVADVGTE